MIPRRWTGPRGKSLIRRHAPGNDQDIGPAELIDLKAVCNCYLMPENRSLGEGARRSEGDLLSLS